MSDLDLLHELENDQAPPPKPRGLSVGSMVLIAGILAVILTVGIALLRSRATQPTDGIAPDFTVTTLDGGTFTLSEQRGTIVILNFWASWCGPCREEAPALERISQRYGDQVQVIGITYNDQPNDSRAFIDEFGITYANADDPRAEISQRLYHIQGVPESFVIDQNGEIANFMYAAVNEAEMIAIIDGLLSDS